MELSNIFNFLLILASLGVYLAIIFMVSFHAGQKLGWHPLTTAVFMTVIAVVLIFCLLFPHVIYYYRKKSRE